MQTILNTDYRTGGKHEMAEHLKVAMKVALDPSGLHMMPVVVHIAAENNSFKE